MDEGSSIASPARSHLDLALEALRALSHARQVQVVRGQLPPADGGGALLRAMAGGATVVARFDEPLPAAWPPEVEPLLALIESLLNAPATEQGERRLHALLQIGEISHQELDLDLLFRRTNEAVREALGAEAASVMLIDERRRCLYFRQAVGESSGRLAEVTVPLGQGIAGWVVEQDASQIVNDCASDPRFSGKVDQEVGFRTRNLACVPLRFRGQVIGVFEALNHPSPAGFTPADMNFLEAMASQVGALVGEARAYRALFETLQTVVETHEVARGGSGRRAALADRLAQALAQRAGLSARARELVSFGALLKDVGSLLGPRDAPSTAWASGAVLAQVEILPGLAEVVLHAGEHFDGTGAPSGLAGAAIPQASRVIAVAAAFVRAAEESGWSYRQALKAIDLLAGKTLDPGLVGHVHAILDAWGYVGRPAAA